MKCPHCSAVFVEKIEENYLGFDSDFNWSVEYTKCTTCKKLIIYLVNAKYKYEGHKNSVPFIEKTIKKMIRPRTSRRSVPKHLSKEITLLYKEACLVINDSPRASALLSRLCLHSIFKDYFDFKGELFDNIIQELIERRELSTEILKKMELLIELGNFKNNTSKSQKWMELIEVEPKEAENYLDLIELFFDYF